MKEKLIPLNECEIQDFEAFWAVWPRRDKRIDAEVAFAQTRHCRPPIDQLCAAVRCATVALEWNTARRPHIPLPASWLRAQRWTDEACRPPAPDLRTRALAAWAEVRMANQREETPAGGWSDPLTAPALKSMGGLGVLRDMLTRDVQSRAREFYEHFKTAAVAVLPASPRPISKPVLRLVPKSAPAQVDLLGDLARPSARGAA